MVQDSKPTKMVFRVWKDGGTVIALMPEIEAKPGYCLSYEHIGQHGAAQYQGVLARTRRAEQHEEIPLILELTDLGYNVRVMVRSPSNRKAPMA